MDERLKKHGFISWSELMTTDVDGAKKFYGDLFGWKFDDMPSEEMVYSVVQTDGDGIGGIMPMSKDAPPMPPCWGIYVTVDKVDETAEKASMIGATIIVPPRDIPDVGRFAVLQDPQGAVISIISYTN